MDIANTDPIEQLRLEVVRTRIAWVDNDDDALEQPLWSAWQEAKAALTDALEGAAVDALAVR